jgi:NTE family protein
MAVIPLHLVASDLIEGREVLLSEGPAIEAIVAAASIPGVFPPVEIADRHLIDGGVVNNTPISHAVELGADRIFVLPTRERGRISERPPTTALDTAIYGLGSLTDGRLRSDIDRYSRDVDLVVLPSANHAAVQPTSFEHSDRLIKQALIAGRARLARHTAEATCNSSHSRGARTALTVAFSCGAPAQPPPPRLCCASPTGRIA